MFNLYEHGKKDNKQIENNSIQPKKELEFEFDIQNILKPKDIIRRDNDFKNTGKPRIGGSSFSSGVFIDKLGNKWLGKADQGDEKLTEALACKEKVSGDIYAYYGANIPKIEISKQKRVNTGFSERDLEEIGQLYSIHVMSELLPNFKTYQEVCGKEFNVKKPNYNNTIFYNDGNQVPEKGLGRILAVASLINDVDVIGASGGNIGFQLQKSETGFQYAKTIKIDPGEAFNTDLSLQVERCIRVALPEEKKGDSQLEFDSLPVGTQKEFLITLHEIARTNEAIFEGFFTRRGAHPFILYFERTVKDLTSLLLKRKYQLLNDYSKELKESEKEYEEWSEAKKQILSIENQARIKEENFTQQQLYFYIVPDVNLVNSNDRVPFDKFIFSDFLDFNKTDKVLLLKGESGAGKSLSLLYIEKILLERKRENLNAPMPIYIDLKKFNTETVKDCLKTVLDKTYYLDTKKLKKQQLVILMDGYDEISSGSKDNLYACQGLEKWLNIKVVISCRTQVLSPGYERWFMPTNNKKLTTEGFKDCTLLPFTTKQIDSYLQLYVEQSERPYNLEEYQKHIESIPNLGELISNPFILRLLTEALPEFLKHAEKGLSINRYAIYEAFMRYWFIKQEKRLHQSIGLKENRDYLKSFEDFSKEIALKLYIHDQIEIKTEDSFWGSYFSDINADTVQARDGCPLQRIDENCYTFIHRSFLEFFAAKAIVEAVQQAKDVVKPEDITKQQAVIDFLRDIIELTPEIKKTCFIYIESSKKEEKFAKVAANAITLLNVVNQSFSNMDFSNIRIPGANLIEAILQETNFENAVLDKVNFENACLSKANLTGASLKEARFCEKPYIKINMKDEYNTSCCYSKDGNFFIFSASRNVYFYDCKSLEVVNFLEYKQDITDLKLSHDGNILAIGCNNNIHLWDMQNATENKILVGNGKISTLDFSPDSITLASSDRSDSIKLWDIRNGKVIETLIANGCYIFLVLEEQVPKELESHHTPAIVLKSDQTFEVIVNSEVGIKKVLDLEGIDLKILKNYFETNHKKVKMFLSRDSQIMQWLVSKCGHIFETTPIRTIAFSPDNGTLAFVAAGFSSMYGSNGDDICLLNLNNKEVIKVLEGVPGDVVCKLIFSPDGSVLVSAARRVSTHYLYFWDVKNGKVLKRSLEHINVITDLSFSPNGDIVASSSWDHTVRLWDVNTQEVIKILEAHGNAVKMLAFSPDGNILASGGEDNIRFLDFKNITLNVREGHIDRVKSLAFSPDGNRLASISTDGKICLWDAKTGKILKKYWEYLLNRQPAAIDFNSDGSKIFLVKSDVILSSELYVLNTEDGKTLETKKVYTIKHGGLDHFIVFGPDGWDPLENDRAIALYDNINIRTSMVAYGNTENSIVYGNFVAVMFNQVKKCKIFKGHIGKITALSFSPDGSILASGSADNTIRLWEIKNEETIKILSAHNKEITFLTFTQDGNTLISRDTDGIYFWDKNGELLKYSKFDSPVLSIRFNKIFNQIALSTDASFKSIKCWEFERIKNDIILSLKWSRPQNILNLNNAIFSKVKGLTLEQELLIKQRGGIINMKQNGAKKLGINQNDSIHLAAARGDMEAVKRFIESGVNVNDQSNDGTTPIYAASFGGHSRLVEILVEADANINSLRNDKSGPIHVAVAMGHAEVVKVLLKFKVDLDKPNINGFTPLHVAASNGNIEIMELLLKDKTILNQEVNGLLANTQIIGYTPLMVAAFHNKKIAVSTLIYAGAKIDHQSQTGFTAIHVAAVKGYVDLMDVLHKGRANLDLKTIAGDTALHLACHNNQKEVVKFLLQIKANLSLKNFSGQSPLDVARAKEYSDIVVVLENYNNQIFDKEQDKFEYNQNLNQKEVVEENELICNKNIIFACEREKKNVENKMNKNDLTESFLKGQENDIKENKLQSSEAQKKGMFDCCKKCVIF